MTANVPSSTYRLQLSPEFGLGRAAALVPYLAALGVSHVYLSPFLQARPGSSGYGVTEPDRVDAALGGEEGRMQLLTALRREGMGMVIDLVPNHMAAHPSNPWWADVVARGRESRWARHFDVWWDVPSIVPGQPAHRRFFDVSDLVGVRQEEPGVYEDTHRLALDWVRAGQVDGLRIDHPDGLRDPLAYFEHLRASAPDAWILAEKILSGDERLPASWPVAGTTGYDFMNVALRLFVDGRGEAPLSRTYRQFTGERADFAETARGARLQVLRTILQPEVDHLQRVAGRSEPEFREALVEYLACLPVYRTYLRPGEQAGEDDRRRIATAVTAARAHRPDLDAFLFEAVTAPGLALDLQQISGGATAKGVEDTAFYRYNRLAALNEVGGDPSVFSITPDEFHAWCAAAAVASPARMNATATHDTKRGEDVRARLAFLSEIPEEWTAAVEDWSRRLPPFADRSLQYLLFQVAAAAHPLSEPRAQAYMLKAAREAKSSTSWAEPDPAFEAALAEQVRLALPLGAAFAARVLEPGWRNSLGMKLLCLTAPGVPDVYQGAELADLSLVDPDNRRPVDFDLRARVLSELDGLDAARAWARAGEGLPKLLLVQRVLCLRRRRADLYGPLAAYEPLVVRGPHADHAVAFMRGSGAITLVPRLLARLDGWAGTSVELPGGSWRDELTGVRHSAGPQPLDGVLAGFPVAVLVREH